MEDSVQLTDCLAATADSAREIATGPLGISTTAWLESSTPLPEALCGIYIPLLSKELAVQVGVLAERPDFVKLAKALLSMQDDEEFESEGDVFDAMGEVANMIAGGIKVRLEPHTNISVGLPLALTGKVFPPRNSQSIHGELSLDDRRAWLVVTGTML